MGQRWEGVGLGVGCGSLGLALGRCRSWLVVVEERHSCALEGEADWGSSCVGGTGAVVVADCIADRIVVRTVCRHCSLEAGLSRGRRGEVVGCSDHLDGDSVLSLGEEVCCRS